MARDVQERENLLRDAKAFVNRLELRFSSGGKTQVVFAGFRREGALSLFFGQDPVYQFNTNGELRRAFERERIIKAEHGRLVGWLPKRSQNATQMLRQYFDDSQQQAFCQRLAERLQSLHQALRQHEFELVGQVPEDEEVVRRLCEWIANWQGVVIAKSPSVN